MSEKGTVAATSSTKTTDNLPRDRPNGDKVMTAPRIAKDYTLSSVVPYTANPINLQPIQQGTFVNRTHVSSTFLCGGCINGDSFDPTPESKSSNRRLLFFGYAYSPEAVREPSNPDTLLSSHIPEAVKDTEPTSAAHNTVLSSRTSTTTAGYGAFSVVLSDAESDKYEQYAALATGDGGGSGLLGVAPEGSPPSSPVQTATATTPSSSPASSTPSSAATAAPDQDVGDIEAAPTDLDFGYRQMSPFGIMALVVLGLVYLGQAFLPS